MLCIVDSGPLLAVANVHDRFHAPALSVLSRGDLDFVVPALCIAEVAHLLARDVGREAEAAFIARCASLDVRAPIAEDFIRMSAVMEQYFDFPLGAVDASVIAIAERLGASTIVTIDHRHFRAIRPKHVEAFTLLPEMPN